MNKILKTIRVTLLLLFLLVIPVQADVHLNIPEYSYTVNYYIDEIDDNSYLGTIVGMEYLNRKIDIDFTYLLPGGYTYTGKKGYYVIEDNMVIDIVYSKKTNLSYCVNYFYGGIISVNDTICYYNQTHGTEVTFFIDKPKEGYVYSGFDPIIILDIDENIMNVYYEKEEVKKEKSSLLNIIFQLFNKILSFIE